MTIRRCLLAGATAVGLVVTAPSPARADISFGDLNDAFDNFGENWIEAVLDSLCAWLLMPIQAPPIDTPFAVPPPVIGDHLEGAPTSPSESAEYVNALLADRAARVEAIDAIVEQSQEAAAANTTQLATLAALNAAPPVSVAAQIQIGNQAAIVDASADATVIHYLSGQMALEADRAFREEQVREIAMAQYNAWADPIQGGSVRDATFRLPW